MDTILYNLKKLVPHQLLALLRPPYHYILTLCGAVFYGFPSREITVIGVTGTKGKSTVTELIAAIFEADGKRTAVASTIRFKIGERSEPNLYKMTMPGRFFIQKFLRDAVSAGCTVAIVEMTSEGARQYRHKFIDLDALVFTNLSPEHIESHGSFEKYKQAKLSLAHALEESRKRPRRIIANVDDIHGKDFLFIDVEKKIPYSLQDPELHTLTKDGVSVVFNGITIRTPLVGLFNVYNVIAAISCAESFGIPLKIIERALGSLAPIKGRVEKISTPSGASKNITAVVDYAHTPDSLEKLYKAFNDIPKICVLGNTGGGRDTWKRPEMGRIAGEYCDHVVLTDEDPYDENPNLIVEAMKNGITDQNKVTVIMDRREAIRHALRIAPDKSVVLISGKGTDPYIMGPRNTKTPWSDAETVRGEIAYLFPVESRKRHG
ncbi:UDP-N-acetylmuramoyl-L-alanyl-D-glutamate--2,6-diaminopimelate ligase [Patescibacteria group bacterium]|nr:UDP-N-acetylmuramoyl-L-alanyl-D-glutamate--2,6-diaminopimelate ligase [Patescibacteria group bacterium]